MQKTIELPEGVYAELLRAAEASGTTPAGWIQDHLHQNGAVGERDQAADDELAVADAALESCIVSLGRALGTDNEQIDEDLAREYGDDRASRSPLREGA